MSPSVTAPPTAQTAPNRPQTGATRRWTPPPATPRWWRDAAGALTWLSMLVVIALWVHDGGLQGLSGTAGWLKGIGQVTGLVASDLLLIQVLMMARIPFVERSYGQDELARRHRWTGFASFWLMIAHIVFITVGYAAGSHTGVLSQLWDMIWTYPGMLIATVGTGLLVMVVVTSIRMARRKLRYEGWHLLHLYAYLGTFLALPHQLWTGGDFLSSTPATAYWWTLWLVAAVAVLQFRVGLPVYRSLKHQLVVERVVTEAPGVVSVHLTGRHLRDLPVRAGQYFVWRFLDGPGWTRGNPYSLSAAPDGRSLRITVKALGEGSARLARLQPGTKAFIEGPYGRLTSDVRTHHGVTMIASGIGVTPLRALLEELDYAPGAATLIYRTSSLADLAFRAELDELAARRGVRVWYVPGHRSTRRGSWLPAGQEKLDPARALLDLVPHLAETDVYVCGPESWMDDVRDAAVAAGVPDGQVHLERFAF